VGNAIEPWDLHGFPVSFALRITGGNLEWAWFPNGCSKSGHEPRNSLEKETTMKMKSLTTVAMTMLGAAFMSQGQTSGRTGSQGGADPSGSAVAPGVAEEQDAGRAAAADERQQSGQAQRDAAQPQDTQALRKMDWGDAEASEIEIREVPQAARDTLNTVAEGAQVSRLTKEGQEIFRATVDRANEEDLHIFVQNDGTVIKTMQQIRFTDAPESVRNAISKQLGGGEDAQPKALYRVIANQETSYVASSAGDDQATIQVDPSGKLLDSKGQSATERQGRTGIESSEED
jgi:hypothetical protein